MAEPTTPGGSEPSRREYFEAWADAAALMLAAVDDRDAFTAAAAGLSPDEVHRVAVAAIELGGQMLVREIEARRPDRSPGPVLGYVVAVARHAADRGRRVG